MASDSRLSTCVLCRNEVTPPADFCEECGGAECGQSNFGRCYECRDALHDRCVGVPCQCQCEGRETGARTAESKALCDSGLAKLTSAERQALGLAP